LKVKESPVRGIYVEGLSEVYIDSIESFLSYVQLSQDQRIVAGTRLNQASSRSHAILILEVTQTFQNENISKKGTLNLVDLAGSEKVSKTGAVGETLEEAKKINLSLSALGNVIHSLTSPDKSHIPYRDSKLTRILQESLGGNYKTSLIVTCSPHSYNMEESISTLKFAQRAKTIKNKAKMNIKLSYEELQKIIDSLRTQLDSANLEITRLKGISIITTENSACVILNKVDRKSSSSVGCEKKISDGEIKLETIPEKKTLEHYNFIIDDDVKRIESNEMKPPVKQKSEAQTVIENSACNCDCEFKLVTQSYRELCEKLGSLTKVKERNNLYDNDKYQQLEEFNKVFKDLANKEKVISFNF
jgi:hypothetical protein